MLRHPLDFVRAGADLSEAAAALKAPATAQRVRRKGAAGRSRLAT